MSDATASEREPGTGGEVEVEPRTSESLLKVIEWQQRDLAMLAAKWWAVCEQKGLYPRLDEVVAAAPSDLSPVDVIRGMMTPSHALNGESPVNWLLYKGDPEAAITAAQLLGQEAE